MTHNQTEDIKIMTHNQTEDIKKIFHNQTEIEKTGLIPKIPLTDNQTHQGTEKLKKPPAVPTTHLDQAQIKYITQTKLVFNVSHVAAYSTQMPNVMSSAQPTSP